ncbi:MAG: hypothetical protein PHV34_03170 [Verrucomicrobiae bacterium]|nr:hypothetical protein [Verrucomicrobiae bacterium]
MKPSLVFLSVVFLASVLTGPVQGEERQEPTKLQLRLRAATKKWDDFHAARAAGKKARVELSAQELNDIFTNLMEFRMSGDKRVSTKFDFEDDKITVRVNRPLDDIPGFKGEIFNGVVVFIPQISDGELSLKIESVRISDKATPKRIVDYLNHPQFLAFLKKHPVLNSLMKGVSRMEVAKKKLILES